MTILHHKYIQIGALFLINALLFAFFAWLLPIHFEANDDVAMCAIANGQYYGVTEPHLVFINYLYGLLVSNLYQWLPNIEWYAFLFAAIQVTAITIIIWLIKNKITPPVGMPVLKYVCFLMGYVLWAFLIINFQFTTTAALITLAGCTCWIFGNSKFYYLVGGICIFIGSLIRLDACAIVVLLLTPLWLHGLLKRKPLLWAVLGTGLLVIIGVGVNRVSYLSDKWNEFYQFNKLRGMVVDNPNVNEISNLGIIPKHIHPEDWYLFISSNTDPYIIGVEDLKDVPEIMRETKLYALPNLFHKVWKEIAHNRFLILLLILLLFAIVSTWNKSNVLLGVILFFLILLTISYICLVGHMHIRIQNIYYWVIFVEIIYFFKDVPKNYIWMVGILVVMICYKGGKNLYFMHKQTIEARNIVKNDVLPLCSKVQQPLVMGFSAHIEGLSPFEISKQLPPFISLGWFAHYPANIGRLDSHKCFVEQHIPILLSTEENNDKLKESIMRNYGIKVYVDTIEKNEKYRIEVIREKR